MFLKADLLYPSQGYGFRLGFSHLKGTFIYHPSPILWKTDPLPQASGVLMGLPTQSCPSGLGVDIQSLLDQSEIFPRIFQIDNKEKVAEDLFNEVGKCELGVTQSHGSKPFGESPSERLKLI